MPFNSKTGAESGRKYGKKGAMARWGKRDPVSIRTEYIPLKVSPDELAMINEKAFATGLSRVELIIRAVRGYES